jgi:hypothetical protein
MTTLCAIHPDVAAIQACDRCGTFGCNTCLSFAGDQRLCTPCIARAGVGLPSLHGRATWAKIGLLTTGVIHVLLGLINLAFDTKSNEMGVGLMLMGLVGLAFFPALILTIVWFCRWFHLSVRYATSRGVTMSHSPAGSVGSWFIPFINLARPFDISRQMLSGTGGDPGIVGRWQALWISGNILSNISSRVDYGPLSLIAGLLLFGAALSAVSVVNAYTRAATSSPTP